MPGPRPGETYAAFTASPASAYSWRFGSVRLEPGPRRRERRRVVEAERRDQLLVLDQLLHALLLRAAVLEVVGQRGGGRRRVRGGDRERRAARGARCSQWSTKPHTQARRPSFGHMYRTSTSFIFAWFLTPVVAVGPHVGRPDVAVDEVVDGCPGCRSRSCGSGAWPGSSSPSPPGSARSSARSGRSPRRR